MVDRGSPLDPTRTLCSSPLTRNNTTRMLRKYLFRASRSNTGTTRETETKSIEKEEARLLGVARAIFRVHLCEVSVSSNVLNMYCRSGTLSVVRIESLHVMTMSILYYDRVWVVSVLSRVAHSLVLSSNEACVSIKRKIESHAASLQSSTLESIEKIVVDSVRIDWRR